MKYTYLLAKRLNDEDVAIVESHFVDDICKGIQDGFTLIGFYYGDFPESIVQLEVESMILKEGL